MQRWADHCSSDEDTDDNYTVEEEQVEEIEPTTIEEEFSDKVQVNTDDTASEEQPDQQQPVRTYDFPDRPPFTAFVGNLSYDIQDTAQLQQGLADVVSERLGEKVRVLGGRICYDRDNTSGQHRGFGYVELESLEELKIVMKLNDDGKATLAGRKIQVDTANHNNRSNNNYNRRGNNHRGSNHGDRRNNSNRDNESSEKIDGSKFRGGKFNNNNNNFRNNFRNNNHSNHSNSNDANGPPRERPSLKLAPRSKPVDADRSSSSNIFGGAKARDEQAWAKSRHQQKEDQKRKTPESPAVEEKKTIKNKDEDHNNKEDKNSSIRRESGRGAGRGGKGRGNQHRNSNNAGRGGDSNHKRGAGKRQPNDKKNDKKKQPASSEEKALPAKAIAKPADAPSSNPEPKKPKNKFALLMDDSDSD